jgi:hypothetical protein
MRRSGEQVPWCRTGGRDANIVSNGLESTFARQKIFFLRATSPMDMALTSPGGSAGHAGEKAK